MCVNSLNISQHLNLSGSLIIKSTSSSGFTSTVWIIPLPLSPSSLLLVHSAPVTRVFLLLIECAKYEGPHGLCTCGFFCLEYLVISYPMAHFSHFIHVSCQRWPSERGLPSPLYQNQYPSWQDQSGAKLGFSLGQCDATICAKQGSGNYSPLAKSSPMFALVNKVLLEHTHTKNKIKQYPGYSLYPLTLFCLIADITIGHYVRFECSHLINRSQTPDRYQLHSRALGQSRG